jgi:hypothetical protein
MALDLLTLLPVVPLVLVWLVVDYAYPAWQAGRALHAVGAFAVLFFVRRKTKCFTCGHVMDRPRPARCSGCGKYT